MYFFELYKIDKIVVLFKSTLNSFIFKDFYFIMLEDFIFFSITLFNVHLESKFSILIILFPFPPGGQCHPTQSLRRGPRAVGGGDGGRAAGSAPRAW